MSEIITTSDYSIDIKKFWISKEDIDKIKEEKKIEEKNRIIIWLIIWEIRKKFFELHMNSIDINHKEISNIINGLNFPLEINQNFQSFEELWSHIFNNYDFIHIKAMFLCNEYQMDIFLKSAQDFLNYNFDNNPKKTDQIINSLQEL